MCIMMCICVILYHDISENVFLFCIKKTATNETDNTRKNEDAVRPPEKEHLSLDSQMKKHQTESKMRRNRNSLVIEENNSN